MNDVFMRNEKKYVLSEKQYRAIMHAIEKYMLEDSFGKYCVQSLYYDTPNRELIVNSMSKPVFKEKLRLRRYTQLSRATSPNKDSEVFMELKRKFSGVVYKRRAKMTLGEAEAFIATGVFPGERDNEQIINELEYFVKFYSLEPAMYIACDRRAYHCPTDALLRMTLDANIRYRADSPCFLEGTGGQMLLPPCQRLLEIKTGEAMPMWLVQTLENEKIYPQTFSKYGNAYTKEVMNDALGGIICA